MNAIELVISGAGTLGPLEVGALAALQERGLRLSFVAGTSAGAISAGLTALGFSPDYLKQVTMSADFSKLIDYAPLGALWRMGYADSSNVRAWLYDISKGQSLGDCVVPFSATTGDTYTMKPHYWKSAKYPDMLMADVMYSSLAIPFVFPPYLDRYVDGGTENNLAVSQLPGRNQGVALRVTEISDTGPWDGWLQFTQRILAMLVGSNELAAEELAAQEKVVTIPLPAGTMSFLDRSMTPSEKEALWFTGYQAVISARIPGVTPCK